MSASVIQPQTRLASSITGMRRMWLAAIRSMAARSVSPARQAITGRESTSRNFVPAGSSPARDHAVEDIPVGDDAVEMAGVADRQRPYFDFPHQLGRRLHRRPRVDEFDVTAHHVADRHADPALRSPSECGRVTAMARVFITGSSDGLGLMAARLLAGQGHAVVLHARNDSRRRDALAAFPGAEACVVGDFTSLAQIRGVAGQVNALGPFDAVIHNAAIGFRENRRIETEDGLAHVFAANTLAPYMLTALIQRPQRLIYVSSELHRRGDTSLADLNWESRTWRGNQAYSDTKFHDALLAFAVARLWPDVRSNALEPGWVATKMGGAHATGDLDAAPRTQVWLATADDTAALTGGYFFHMRPKKPHGALHDTALQDKLLAACARTTGITLPES